MGATARIGPACIGLLDDRTELLRVVIERPERVVGKPAGEYGDDDDRGDDVGCDERDAGRCVGIDGEVRQDRQHRECRRDPDEQGAGLVRSAGKQGSDSCAHKRADEC
jgi:hypothetical protein